MYGVLVMRTVQVKPVKTGKAHLTEHRERRDKEGEREGATLREGRPGSARLQIASSLSDGSPRILRNGSNENLTIKQTKNLKALSCPGLLQIS